MKKTLTEKQKQIYLKDSDYCPFCGSENIEGSVIDFYNNKVYQCINCNSCNLEWYDEYTLTGVIEK